VRIFSSRSHQAIEFVRIPDPVVPIRIRHLNNPSLCESGVIIMGMRIPSASSSTANVGGASAWQAQRQTFKQLSQALQAGDLTAAKSAFDALSAKSPNASDPNSPLAKLGQAIASGDVAAAQQAFSALRSGGHHHRHGTPASPATQSAPQSLATTGTVGTQVNTVV
jgi:hypothetical protein